MQWPRNRNVLVVAVVVLLAVALAALGMTARGPRSVSDEPLPGAEAAEGSGAAADDAFYLVVTVGRITYEPILLEAENELTLSQGEDTVNVIHVTTDSIWMESSTCENQDCVEQGVVSADNREYRILGNAIICLPNRVQLELFSAEELKELGFVMQQ